MFADDHKLDQSLAALLNGKKRACGCGECGDCRPKSVDDLGQVLGADPLKRIFGASPMNLSLGTPSLSLGTPRLSAVPLVSPDDTSTDPPQPTSTPVSIGEQQPNTPIGASLKDVLLAGLNATGQVAQAIGQQSQPIFVPTGDPLMPEPTPGRAQLSTITMAPVQIKGTTVDLEPDPSQWFHRHPMVTFAVVGLIIYLLFMLAIQGRK